MDNNISNAISTITAKIGEAFNVFDLSFVVSGVACLGGLLFLTHRYEFIDFKAGTIILIVSLVMVTYILGLLCFIIGRTIRREMQPTSLQNVVYPTPRGIKVNNTSVDLISTVIEQAIKTHFIDDNLLQSFIQNNLPDSSLRPVKDIGKLNSMVETPNYWRLYLSLWVLLRQDRSLSVSYSMANRYWVQSAMYDGLAVAVMLWTYALLAGNLSNEIRAANILVGGILLTILCFREASRCEYYQVEEVIASIAFKMRNA